MASRTYKNKILKAAGIIKDAAVEAYDEIVDSQPESEDLYTLKNKDGYTICTGATFEDIQLYLQKQKIIILKEEK